DAAEVVAHQVNDHVELGLVLGAVAQLARFDVDRTRALNGPGDDAARAGVEAEEELGTHGDDGAAGIALEVGAEPSVAGDESASGQSARRSAEVGADAASDVRLKEFAVVDAAHTLVDGALEVAPRDLAVQRAGGKTGVVGGGIEVKFLERNGHAR